MAAQPAGIDIGPEGIDVGDKGIGIEAESDAESPSASASGKAPAPAQKEHQHSVPQTSDTDEEDDYAGGHASAEPSQPAASTEAEDNGASQPGVVQGIDLAAIMARVRAHEANNPGPERKDSGAAESSSSSSGAPAPSGVNPS